MTEKRYDIVFLGGGPAGYVGAIRAAQLGLTTACIEKSSTLGGTCLNIGCIPSKALLDSSERFAEARQSLKTHGILVDDVRLDLPAMMRRKEKIVAQLTKGIAFLFKKNKIDAITGEAQLQGNGQVRVVGEQTVTVAADRIVIATGSTAATLPNVPFVKDRIGSSTEALSYPAVPPRLVVIGAGAIGIELGSVWRRLGSEVTILEYMDRILPGADEEIAKHGQRVFKKQGIVFELSAQVSGARVTGDECTVAFNDKEIQADQVLVAVGRSPNTSGLNLEGAGVQTNPRGFITVDDNYQTSVPSICAVGDVIGGPLLAHKASEEAVACVEKIATGTGHVDYDTLPGVVYTDPEVAQVGKTEAALKQANIPYRKGTFSFRGIGRSLAMGKIDGLVKILAHATTDRVLGVHIIGPHAGDLITEAATAMALGASSEDMARTWHAHPTLSEAVKEAALDVNNRAIHA
ncbi:MAG: dihydrolipoyl dehydrogenase [Myxococcota bacterium]|nr:dihydrolipoyl dehydrogenase [Myxococcota bacterium]